MRQRANEPVNHFTHRRSRPDLGETPVGDVSR